MSRSHENIATSTPTCPKCHGTEFELRVMRDEAVAATRCLNCSAQYLLLDSKDYWFDVIQKGYPRAARCSCKSNSFHLSVSYRFRDGGDIDYIEVRSTCSACGKARRQLAFEVDYSPTGHLLKRPLVRVKNPKILYDLKDINLHVTFPDIARIVDYLGGEAKCSFVSYVRSGDRWIQRTEEAAEVKATIEGAKYLFIYAMPARIDIPEDSVKTTKGEDTFWKRSEVIRIGSRSHVCTYSLGDASSRHICYRSDRPTLPGETEIGLSFDVNFSNEFVRGERTIAKSESFRTATEGLLAMLRREFVCWRGPDCFDNPDVNFQVFGERFRKRAVARGGV